jgi:hypothetical protein
LAGTKN